ncbi:MAG: family 2A encapsulin nanocompartment cargo protein cysteine desulfurase [Methylovulum sp.]|nr:family 2A encapsulin nanocompartment cargo protein cysteine desulfurase [Methylovulum sp.]
MNISDFDPLVGQSGDGVQRSVPEVSAEQLERMANELFLALPGATGNDVIGLMHQQIDKQAAAHPKALACSTGLAGLAAQALGIGVDTAGAGDVQLRQLLTQLPQADTHLPMHSASGTAFYFLDDLQDAAPALQIPALAPASPAFDVQAVRRDFPILQERVNGRPLIWLDNAATTQKPQCVIDRLAYFYRHENSNIHRAAHELAARATDAYEDARDTVARFLHASASDEIVFVRGATEAINLVAQSWGRQHIGKGDEIVITWLEHHANIVPWQQLCKETGACLRVAPVDDNGQVLLDEYERLLNPRTRLVAFTQVSNALGTVTPAREMIAMARRHGARVLVDGAQSVAHLRVDVQALDCDWLVFSGHKIFGPTGIGVVYGKRELLNATQPWQGGGNMIEDVTFEHTRYHQAPARFEAGTGNIADAVGLAAALTYIEKLGIENINRYEHELLGYAVKGLATIPGLRLIGTAPDKASVLSFVLEGFATEDVGAALNREGIAVRSGHHCAQPILRRFGVESTVRPSLAFYNTHEEIDVLVAALRRLQSSSKALSISAIT